MDAKSGQLDPVGLRTVTPSLVQWATAHQGWCIFAVGSAVGIRLAEWLSFTIGFVPVDALSRTYSAAMVVHSRYPHLAAIGFIWPPLPAMAQLPLTMRIEWTHYGFSGGVVTALAAGALLSTLNEILRWAKQPPIFRLLALLLFAINPMWLFYAGNGMSEMPFMLFLSMATATYIHWTKQHHWRDPMIAGFVTALMFGCRYDTLAYAAAFTATMVVLLVRDRRNDWSARAEAHLLAYLVPVSYAMFLWIFFNWLIMGDALFFLRSEYSNAYLTRNMSQNPHVMALQKSWGYTLQYLLIQLGNLSPLLLVLIPIAAFRVLHRRDFALAGMLLLTMSVPLFQLIMYRNGQTFGFARFYMSVQPSALLLAAYLLYHWRGRAYRSLQVLTLFSLAVGIWTTLEMMQYSVDGGFIQALRSPGQQLDNTAADRRVAVELNSRFADKSVLILADSGAEQVVLFSRMPKRFIVPSDLDFQQALEDLTSYADYILISKQRPDDIGYRAIQARYPTLYENGGTGLELDSQMGDFRLYRNVERTNRAAGQEPPAREPSF